MSYQTIRSWKPQDRIFIRLDTIPERDEGTDRQTESLWLLQRSALRAMRTCCNETANSLAAVALTASNVRWSPDSRRNVFHTVIYSWFSVSYAGRDTDLCSASVNATPKTSHSTTVAYPPQHHIIAAPPRRRIRRWVAIRGRQPGGWREQDQLVWCRMSDNRNRSQIRAIRNADSTLSADAQMSQRSVFRPDQHRTGFKFQNIAINWYNKSFKVASLSPKEYLSFPFVFFLSRTHT